MYSSAHKMIKYHPLEAYEDMHELARIFFWHTELVKHHSTRNAQKHVQNTENIALYYHNEPLFKEFI
jgi:hypothetical protein